MARLGEDDVLGLNGNEPVNVEHELERFRQQWRTELQGGGQRLGNTGTDGKLAQGCVDMKNLKPTVEEEVRFIHIFYPMDHAVQLM